MKNQQITIAPIEHDPILESMIQKKDEFLKEQVRRNAKHYAKENRPAAEGDSLSPYLGEPRTGYEQLAADTLHHLQPANHFPEGKMDADFYKDKDKQIDGEIKAREDLNSHDNLDLNNYHPGSLPLRMWIAGIVTFIIALGETIFNTKSLQVIGENLLLSLLLSIGVSCGVYAGSHFASFLYKGARTRIRRWSIIICSLTLATGVFFVLAVWRSSYLATHDVHIEPVYFVIFNLFFFLVSALISFFLLPTWEEIKEQMKHFRVHKEVKKRIREINALKKEKQRLKVENLASTKYHMRSIQYANYLNGKIRSMYFESVEIFKGTNMLYRTDRRTPDCFTDHVQEPNIDEVNFTYISNTKAS